MVWDFVEDMWDNVKDFIVELPSNIGEFVGSMFENMGEFSFVGIAFGVVSAGIIFGIEQTPYGTISAFTKGMNLVSSVTWTVATYLVCFVGGYLIGKHFENTG